MVLPYNIHLFLISIFFLCLLLLLYPRLPNSWLNVSRMRLFFPCKLFIRHYSISSLIMLSAHFPFTFFSSSEYLLHLAFLSNFFLVISFLIIILGLTIYRSFTVMFGFLLSFHITLDAYLFLIVQLLIMIAKLFYNC